MMITSLNYFENMKKIFHLFMLSSLLIFWSCNYFADSSKKYKKGSLPKNPKEIIINWFYDAGMLNENKRIFISNDSCYYLSSKNGLEQKIDFILDDDELLKLYDVFLTQKFDKIRTFNDDGIYDRGGTSINITANKINSFSISNSGQTFVSIGYIDNYNVVESSILNVVEKKTEKQKVEVQIDLDTSISNYKDNIQLFINGELKYDKDKNDSFNLISLNLFSMNNKIEVYFLKPSQNNSYPKLDKHYELIVDELEENGKIILKIVNDKLEIVKFWN